ncbi:acyclic terpene utilization AtuA family protein [Oceanicella actignis]|uniref:Terpene utilization protein AtuA n=1 Tax=Oceanicella actignis TaxID=1189325 RepID=A0A1M7T160_9RHOB|nr:acyclic terpene utilization AtuA family protein [Oceanicella actignis]SET37591.1 Protein of unknown function [Oceanicella actignis]SHN64493.1 Protein of unknown function [Oceanicella actignis]
MADIIRIGGASGFWGDAPHAARQLLDAGVDALIFDYLAEITMSIMARARAADPAMGYATDFVTAAMAPNLRAIARGGVAVVSNAGGVNPPACAAALRAEIARQGLDLTVACVTGDDLTARAAEFADRVEMFSGAPFPPAAKVASINAYLGAVPIAEALRRGADVVVAGRCADSALALGVLMHRFGWGPDDHDLLAAGSLVGHLLECGTQATGGNFTDWRTVGDFARIGYPIAEVRPDGTADIVLPEGCAGLVSPATVGEQMLYEIEDPQSYALPDVICDFSGVTLTQAGPNRVRVAGARGRAPSGLLKVGATWADGFRAGQIFAFEGRDAREKAAVFARAVEDRARAALRAMNAPDFDRISAEISGGRVDDPPGYEEVALKLAVRHADARAVATYLKAAIGLALSAPPGLSMFAGARPKPSPVVRLFSFLLPAEEARARLDIGDPAPLPAPRGASDAPPPRPAPPPPPEAPAAGTAPLERLAWARSGDKGDRVNVGVIARRPEWLPLIWAALTEERVAEVFARFGPSRVERFLLPGINAMNIVLHDVLEGGGVASLRADPQGKGYAQRLLAAHVPAPAELAEAAKPREGRP